MTMTRTLKLQLSELRPSLQEAIENLVFWFPQDDGLSLDVLALVATKAIILAESMLKDDPDNRDARSLVYDSETVSEWLRNTKL